MKKFYCLLHILFFILFIEKTHGSHATTDLHEMIFSTLSYYKRPSHTFTLLELIGSKESTHGTDSPFISTEKTHEIHDRTIDIYGLSRDLRPQYLDTLSPAIADNLIKTNILKNLYLLGSTETETLVSEKFLSKDPVIKLIRFLFKMIPGDNDTLLIPCNSQIFGFHLKASTIGKILNAILFSLKKDPNHIVQLIQNDIIPEGFVRSVAAVHYKNLGETINSDQLSSIEERGFDALIQIQKELDREMDPRKKNPHRLILGQATKNLNRQIDPFKATTFVKIFLDALNECSRPQSIYSKDFPLQILLAQALLRSSHYQNTLDEILKFIPRALYSEKNRPLVLDQKTVDNELRKIHDLIWYSSPSSKANIRCMLRYLTFPDETLPVLEFGRTTRSQSNSPVFNQSLVNTEFKVGGDGPTVVASDCCEAVLLSFLYKFLLLKKVDPGDGLPFSFEALKKYSIQPDEKFIDFVRHIPVATLFDTKDLIRRSKWKEYTSNLPELNYLGEQILDGIVWKYDMQPTVDNFIALVDHVYPGISTVALDHSISHTLEDGSIEKTLPTRLEKLNSICKVLNCTPHVDSALEPAQDKQWDNATIKFFRKSLSGEKPSEALTLKITPLHCMASAPQFTNAEQNHFMQLFKRHYEELLPILIDMEDKHDSLSHILARACVDNEIFQLSDAVDILAKHPKLHKTLLPILANFPLNDSEEIWTFVETVMNNSLQSYYPMALKYLKILPLDCYRFFKIASLLSQFIPLKSDGIGFESIQGVPDELKKDFYTILQVTFRDPILVEQAISSANTTTENEIKQWIRQMQDHLIESGC